MTAILPRRSSRGALSPPVIPRSVLPTCHPEELSPHLSSRGAQRRGICFGRFGEAPLLLRQFLDVHLRVSVSKEF
jgi:hypothetical protein